MSIKKSMDGAEEMGQCLKALDSLLEGQSSILEIQFQGIQYFGLHIFQAYMWSWDMHEGKAHIHIKINKEKVWIDVNGHRILLSHKENEMEFAGK